MDFVANSFMTFGTVLQGNLAPSLTVLGWFILLVNTDRIALRNESRSSIDICIKKIDDLMELTTDFHNEKDKTSELNYRFETSAASILSIIETKHTYLQKRTKFTFITPEQLADLRTLFVPSLDQQLYDKCVEDLLDTVEKLEENFAARFSEKWYGQLKLIPRVVLVLFIVIVCASLIAA